MTWKLASALALGAALMLGGCSGHTLDWAEDRSETDQSFSKKLQDGYVKLSEQEDEEADYRDADYFAWNAISSSADLPPLPSTIPSRDLPPEHVGELAEARRRLMAVLSRHARIVAPDVTAEAQLKFDCWIQEQEENRQPKDIAACRAGFFKALAAAEKATEEISPQSKRVVVPKPLRGNFVVYFAHDKVDITDKAHATLTEMAGVAGQFGVYRVLVAGHADRSGAVAYNQRLSERRAVEVIKVLTALGIEGHLVDMKAYGELRPAVPTPDGVREQANRRVELDFTK